MENWFGVDHLDVGRLLAEWRWLCPKPMALVARNVFGDLFLRNESGEIHRLDVAVGKLARVADSEAQFRELAATQEKREQWFAEADEQATGARGLMPNASQCIGFSVPLMFARRTERIVPALAWLTSARDDQAIVCDPQIDRFAQPALLDEGLGNADAARVADAHEVGFHRRTCSS